MTTCKASIVFYALSIIVFVIQCIWSVVGISPFVRIALFITVALCLHIGSVAKAQGRELQTAQRVMKNTYLLMFALYFLLFIALVFIDGYFAEDIRGNSGRTVESFKEYRDSYMSIVPFKTSERLLYAAKMNWISPKKPLLNIGGNLLLCTPFAFFLPLFFKRQHNFFIFFLTVSGVSVLVESIQLLTRRGFCDIDDLIFNVIGACAVFGLLHIKPLRILVTKMTKLQY